MQSTVLSNDWKSMTRSVDDPRAAMLKIDPQQFAANFNEQHFMVEHRLKDHPLFEIPRLLGLAKEVATKWPTDLYFDCGVTNIGQRWEATPNSFPVDETIRKIESSGAWINLNSAERNPEYAKVLDQCVSDLLCISGRQLKKKIRRTQLAIFITSPKRITTYHIDSECNFLLQIRGNKEISLFSKHDREVLPEHEIERSWAVDTNAAVYKPGLQNHADVVTLTPGVGVHIPVNAPHWVLNGSEVSVSAAILYHSWNRSYANLYAANYFLRRAFHIDPSPPFRSRVLDAVKQPLGAAYIWARKTKYGPVRRY